MVYGEREGRALPIPFVFDQVVDLANPHISMMSYDGGSSYIFWVSFFIPSEGVKPGSGASAGEFTALTMITWP